MSKRLDKAMEEVSLQEQVAAYEKEANRWKRQALSTKAGTDIVYRAVASLIPDRFVIEVPKRPAKQRGVANEEAVLHVSDVQFGRVTPTYDTAAAELALMTIAERAIEITEVRRKSAKIEKLHLMLGGDEAEGENIRLGHAHVIDSDVMEQAVLRGPAAFLRMILRLLECYEYIDIHGVSGNHGRPGHFKNDASPRTNWDMVLYKILEYIMLGCDLMPRNEFRKRVRFFLDPDSFFSVARVFDWGILMVHGHQIKGGAFGFPYYGTARRTAEWMDGMPKAWDYLIFGHWHQYADGVYGWRRWFANGTTMTDDEHALEAHCVAKVPMQRMMFLSRDHGILADCPIYLQNPQPTLTRKLER